MEDTGDPRERNESKIDMTSEEVLDSKDRILDDLVKMLTGILDISPTDVRADMAIEADFALDSLQLYELVLDLEEAYDIRIPDTMLETVKTVGDVVDMVYLISISND